MFPARVPGSFEPFRCPRTRALPAMKSASSIAHRRRFARGSLSGLCAASWRILRVSLWIAISQDWFAFNLKVDILVDVFSLCMGFIQNFFHHPSKSCTNSLPHPLPHPRKTMAATSGSSLLDNANKHPQSFDHDPPRRPCPIFLSQILKMGVESRCEVIQLLIHDPRAISFSASIRR